MMKKYGEEIIAFLSNRGYEPLDEHYGIIAYINGVKIEWNTNARFTCLVIGYLNSQEDRENLYGLICDNYGKKSVHSNAGSIRFKKNPKPGDFYRLVDLIEDLPFDIQKPAGQKRGRFEYSSDNLYRKMAKYTRMAVEDSNPGLLNRDTMGVDRNDRIIIIGESTNYKSDESGRREHVVPCDFLIREGVEMVKEGKADWEIAFMYQQNLLIVLISKEEQEKLDGEMGLKVDMPVGWKIGDNPFERLTSAGIELKWR